MQSELDLLYEGYLKRIFDDPELNTAITDFKISSPQFLDVATPRATYLNAPYRVLYIGKETNYWFNKEQRHAADLMYPALHQAKYLTELKATYFRFNIGEKYNYPFYTFYNLLKSKLTVNTGMLITELIRHDAFGNGKIDAHLVEKVCYDNNYILRREIEILKPDALVFVTGPTYDYLITHTFPTVQFKNIYDYSIRERAVLTNIPGIDFAIRVYHPDAHWRQYSEYRYETSDIIAAYLNSRISHKIA